MGGVFQLKRFFLPSGRGLKAFFLERYFSLKIVFFALQAALFCLFEEYFLGLRPGCFQKQFFCPPGGVFWCWACGPGISAARQQQVSPTGESLSFACAKESNQRKTTLRGPLSGGLSLIRNPFRASLNSFASGGAVHAVQG